jgi:hypothetical protein
MNRNDNFVPVASRRPASPSGDTTPATRPSRAWAAAGLAAGIGGLALFIGPGSMLTVSTDSLVDNELVVDEIAGKQNWVWAFQTGSVAIALLIVVFGLGLRRRLATHEAPGSLVPDLAAIGMYLTAGLILVGGGISTELFHALRHADEVDADVLGVELVIFNSIAWVWTGGLLTTAAVAVAGLRRRSVSKALGRFAAVMSGLIVLTQLVPLQYLVVAPVSLFLIVAGISMLRSELPANVSTATSEGDKFRGTNTPHSHTWTHSSSVAQPLDVRFCLDA